MKPRIDFEKRNIFGPAIHVTIPQYLKISAISSLFERHIDSKDPVLGEAHNFWEVTRVSVGEGRSLLNGQLIHQTPQQVFIYEPYAYHAPIDNPADRTVQIFSFISDSPCLERLGNRAFTLTDEQMAMFEAIISAGKEYWRTQFLHPSKDRELIISESGIPAYQRIGNMMENFLLSLIESDIRSSGNSEQGDNDSIVYQDERIKRLTNFLNENIFNNLTLEEISKNVNIGSATLQKICKKYFGCGPISYFLTLKIRMAKKMIAGSSKNFSQIAEELGFSSIHYFSNLFKDRTGVSPSTYAKAIQSSKTV